MMKFTLFRIILTFFKVWIKVVVGHDIKTINSIETPI